MLHIYLLVSQIVYSYRNIVAIQDLAIDQLTLESLLSKYNSIKLLFVTTSSNVHS